MIDIDTECMALCDAINNLWGLETTASCCGHGKDPYRIWVDAHCLCDLPPLAYYLMWCHCGFEGWNMIVSTDCGMAPVSFVVEGPVGDEAYVEAERIAELLGEYVRDEKHTY